MIARSPDLRLIYDDRAKEEKDRFSLVKDARAEGRVEGRVEGEARGKLMGQVQMFERLLGLPATEEAVLSGMSQTELAALVSDLEQRFRNRD